LFRVAYYRNGYVRLYVLTQSGDTVSTWTSPDPDTWRQALPDVKGWQEGKVEPLPPFAPPVDASGRLNPGRIRVVRFAPERGLRDVVVLERDAVGAGTTSKAAGGIRAQFPTEVEIRFSLESKRVFSSFKDEFGVDPDYKEIGYLFLVTDEADLRGFEERIRLQRSLGVDVRVISPPEARELVPALRVDDLVAAVWGPTDGYAGPAEITSGFARRARELGARILEGVEVTAIDVQGGCVRAVRTGQGTISTPLAVNAAGPA